MSEPREFKRELRPEELHVSLRSIAGRLDDSLDALVNVVRVHRDAWEGALVGQVKRALGARDAEAIAAVSVPQAIKDKMRPDVLRLLQGLERYGRQTVAEETASQRRELTETRSFAEVDDSAIEEATAKLFWVRSGRFLNRLSARAEDAAIEVALGIHRRAIIGGSAAVLDPADLDDLAAAFDVTVDKTAKMEARMLVSEAFGQGRKTQHKRMANEYKFMLYSAILDENSCDVCAAMDGERFAPGSAEWEAACPPNKNCLGGNRCRCLEVGVHKDEQESVN